MKKIYPSILAADFSRLGEEIRSLENAGADGIHLDVMDGKFVENITFGIPVIRDIRKCTKLFLDVHLMIEEPERYIKKFAEAGADGITFHIEASKDPYSIIKLIKETGKQVGISLKPSTEIASADILKDINTVLVMSVEPGFGGQKYIGEVNKKIEALAKLKYENDLDFEIEVDGGINSANINDVSKCGADIFVAGSFIFSGNDKMGAISKLRNAIRI